MISVLAIDPGAVHVGLALFEGQDPIGDPAYPMIRRMQVSDWHVAKVWELQPISLESYLDNALDDGWITEGVIEDFNLVGTLMAAQRDPSVIRRSKDVNLTIECIGAVKAYFRRYRLPLRAQNPSVQRNATDWLMRQGIELQSVKQRQGGHAKSAELHGWWYVKGKYKLRAT